MNYNCECPNANGFAVMAEDLDVFRLGDIATGGKMIASGNFSFAKRTSVISESEG
jgi:hypothetical protein